MDLIGVSQEQMMNLLDQLYGLSINGIPGTPTSTDLANEYIEKYKNNEKAIDNLVNAQLVKSATSGFVTNLGGLITIPVAVPANIASVLYLQMRMIAAIAVIRGYNPQDDEVQTFVYACLAGMSAQELVKKFGVKFGNKLALGVVKKIPGTVLTKINRAVGFRLVTKFGQTGLVNLGKVVPIVGGFIGAGFDFATTNTIAGIAKDTFTQIDPVDIAVDSDFVDVMIPDPQSLP